MRPYPDPPRTVSPGDLPEPELTPEGIPIPAFTPWRPKRERVTGWLPDTQRAFIRELTRIGSVSAAARAVGKTARSAYQLREKAGAESFAAAWEMAVMEGQDHAQQIAIERALHGEVMPTFRRGKFTGYKMVYNTRLLVAALGSAKRYGDGFDMPPLRDWQRRLEKWEVALRREAMDLNDMKDAHEREGSNAATQEARDEAWQDHVVWRREMKKEARRQRNLEIREAVRRGMAKEEPEGPKVRFL